MGIGISEVATCVITTGSLIVNVRLEFVRIVGFCFWRGVLQVKGLL
jgi:hypothetical protein